MQLVAGVGEVSKRPEFYRAENDAAAESAGNRTRWSRRVENRRWTPFSIFSSREGLSRREMLGYTTTISLRAAKRLDVEVRARALGQLA